MVNVTQPLNISFPRVGIEPTKSRLQLHAYPCFTTGLMVLQLIFEIPFFHDSFMSSNVLSSISILLSVSIQTSKYNICQVRAVHEILIFASPKYNVKRKYLFKCKSVLSFRDVNNLQLCILFEMELFI